MRQGERESEREGLGICLFFIVKMAHKLNKRAARQSASMFANWACGDFLRSSSTRRGGGLAGEGTG